MAKWFGELAALPGILGLVLSTSTVPNNYLKLPVGGHLVPPCGLHEKQA